VDVEMSPREQRDQHKLRLQKEAEAELGISAGRRIFESAEGHLSPLTATHAAQLALDLDVVVRGAKGEKITIGNARGGDIGFGIAKHARA
jgi:hypothetical protein